MSIASASSTSKDVIVTQDDTVVSNCITGPRPSYVHFQNEAFAPFLPSDGDFTIICRDSSLGDERNPSNRRSAFLVRKSDLMRESPFFSDMFASTTTEGEQSVKIGARGITTLLLLSAAFEPERSVLAEHRTWKHLNGALLLAAKLQMERAQQGLFMAMLSRIKDTAQDLGDPASVTEFFAEAARQGDAALEMAKFVFRQRYTDTEESVRIGPLKVSQLHFMQLGSERCSLFVDIILTLAIEGVFCK